MLLILCGSCRQQPEAPRIWLTNPGNFTHKDAPVVIKRDELRKSLGMLPAHKFLLLKDSSGKVVPSQMDDLDQDGQWDEVAFLYSFAAGQKLWLNYSWVDSADVPAFEKRSHVYLGKWDSLAQKYVPIRSEQRPADHHRQFSVPFLYQMEGPAWENDKVAFREYFDERNDKDIYGKRRPEMQLEQIGAPGAPSYHDLQPWGMDILNVSNSLGAGSLALYYKDSLYALGQTDSARVDLLVDGPLRSVLRLRYAGWQVAGQSYDLQEDITIWAGIYGYMSEVSLKGPLDSVDIVTGIADLAGRPVTLGEDYGNFQSWGDYGAQSEHHDNLGMAIIVPNAELVYKAMAPRLPMEDSTRIANSLYVRLKSEPQPVRFYFYAGWAMSDDRFKDRSGFLSYLREQAQFLNNPILVNVPVHE